ncbi:MAG: recombinase family protein [Chlamydiales bacterium]|nr:recombinase family protein [Chlamydiales bacterium]
MKIVGYLRVSTDQQVESGLGLEAQKSACESYANKIGAEISEFFRDEGLSGSLSLEKRPGMLDAINALKKSDILVVAKRDRLGRDPLVLAMIESAITRKGAKIVSVAGEGTDNEDPSSILMRRMVDAFSEYERLIIGARTKAALKAKKEKGQRVGHIPFGYKLAEDSVNIVKNDVEYSVINEMSELRAKGLSIRDTAIAMNKKGFLNRRQTKWNHASLHRVMKNQKTAIQK